MVNTRLSELEFLVSVLTDLQTNYPEHDNKTLAEILSIVRFRYDATDKTIEHKSLTG